MKRKTKASKASNTTRGKKPAKPHRAGTQVAKVLALIPGAAGNPALGDQPRLKLGQSDAPRAALIKRGLIRKEKDGTPCATTRSDYARPTGRAVLPSASRSAVALASKRKRQSHQRRVELIIHFPRTTALVDGGGTPWVPA
jgi:hypothetical protein